MGRSFRQVDFAAYPHLNKHLKGICPEFIIYFKRKRKLALATHEREDRQTVSNSIQQAYQHQARLSSPEEPT